MDLHRSHTHACAERLLPSPHTRPMDAWTNATSPNIRNEALSTNLSLNQPATHFPPLRVRISPLRFADPPIPIALGPSGPSLLPHSFLALSTPTYKHRALLQLRFEFECSLRAMPAALERQQRKSKATAHELEKSIRPEFLNNSSAINVRRKRAIDGAAGTIGGRPACGRGGSARDCEWSGEGAKLRLRLGERSSSFLLSVFSVTQAIERAREVSTAASAASFTAADCACAVCL